MLLIIIIIIITIHITKKYIYINGAQQLYWSTITNLQVY